MPNIDYQGLTNVYTYMGWQLVTDPTSAQYKLREAAGQNFDSEGFGIINGCYVIACTSRYGEVGDYINWTLANGSVLKTIIGDVKSSNDPNNNTWGHTTTGGGLSVVEFVVDYNTWYPSHDNPGTANCHPEWAGQIQSYENVGNYYTGGGGNTSGLIPNITGTGVAFITGVKYVDGNTVNVFYIGNAHEDGYIYFIDENLYRCDKDRNSLQIFYWPKQIWIRSEKIITISTVILFNIGSLVNGLGNLFGGGGVTNPDANVEKAVQWAIQKAQAGNVTYSQSNRNLKNPDGYSYDCSSFIITAYYVGGFDINATYTGDMKAGFTAAGFQWIPGDTFYSNDLVRGDILLNETYHTQMYIGNNQDVNCGSTPAKIEDHSPNYGGTGWDGVLRYVGSN